MAQRRVDGFERVLRPAVVDRLAIANFDQFAADRIDDVAFDLLRRCGGAFADAGERLALIFEMPQDFGEMLLDAAGVAGALIGALEPFEQVGDALLDLRHRRGAVGMAEMIDAFG